jgi:hypothetical protein
MKIGTALFAASALVMVAGCSRQPAANNVAAPANAAGDNQADEPEDNEPAPAGNEGAAAAGGEVDQAFLVGRWGVAGNCSQVMTFNEDGTGSPPAGSRWSLAGNVVTWTNPGGPAEPQTVTRTGDDSFTTVTAAGQSLNMTRCPAE